MLFIHLTCWLHYRNYMQLGFLHQSWESHTDWRQSACIRDLGRNRGHCVRSHCIRGHSIAIIQRYIPYRFAPYESEDAEISSQRARDRKSEGTASWRRIIWQEFISSVFLIFQYRYYIESRIRSRSPSRELRHRYDILPPLHLLVYRNQQLQPPLSTPSKPQIIETYCTQKRKRWNFLQIYFIWCNF